MIRLQSLRFFPYVALTGFTPSSFFLIQLILLSGDLVQETGVETDSAGSATYTLPFAVSAADYENFEASAHSFITSDIVSSRVAPIDC